MERGGRKRQYHARRFDGCVQCKKLKVKCTREKPACMRCQRLKSDCTYSDLKVWTLGEPHAKAAQNTAAAVEMVVALPHSYSKISSIDRQLPNSPASVSWATLQSSGMQIQLIQQLYDSIIPDEEITPRMDQFNWFETVIAYPQKGPALEQMLKAMALKRFAFLHNDERFDQAGGRAYITGLRTIQSKLSDEATMKDDDTIAAIRAAYTYEQLFTSSEGTSVSSHWRGLQQLVATGEPKGGWGKLARVSIRSTLTAQGQALLRDASGGSMTPLLANAIRELNAIDSTDAVRLDRSVDMIRLISLGEKIRQAQRTILKGGEFNPFQLQELEKEIALAEKSIHTVFHTFIQGREGRIEVPPRSATGDETVPPDSLASMETLFEQLTVIAPSQNAASKIADSCFFNLWLLDLVDDFEAQTGVRFELPATRKMMDPAYRIALSLSIVRGHHQLIKKPSDVLLAIANSYALCLAQKTLTKCAPHLLEESATAIEKSILTGNGALRHHMSRVALGELPEYF